MRKAEGGGLKGKISIRTMLKETHDNKIKD